jgi:hypothetical protein
MRSAHAIFGLLFLLSAAVQYNDPDGLIWGAWYAGAAATCFFAARRPKEAAMVAAILCLGSVAWAGSIVSSGLTPITLDALFGDMKMKTENTEKWRETGGLVIAATWMLVVTLEGLRQRKRKRKR